MLRNEGMLSKLLGWFLLRLYFPCRNGVALIDFQDIDTSGDIHLEDIIDSQFIGPQDPEIVQETCEADLADLDYFMILDGPRPDDCGLFLHPTWTESMEAVVGEMFDVGLLEVQRPFCPYEFMEQL